MSDSPPTNGAQPPVSGTVVVICAIAATACAVVPIVLNAINGSEALAEFGPYQPLLLVLAACSVAAAFWSVHLGDQAAFERPDGGGLRPPPWAKVALWSSLGILILASWAEWRRLRR